MRKKLVGCNPLVLRQTKSSSFPYYQGTWKQLVTLVEAKIKDAVAINLEGTVKKLALPPDEFFSAVVWVTQRTPLLARFRARERAKPGEQPYLQVFATEGEKLPAVRVEVILFHISALKGKERRKQCGRLENAEWQIVSIKACAETGTEPATPMDLARNHAAALGLPEGAGGTHIVPTAEEYRESILYWSKRALLIG